jgi:hypothetical protein
MKITFIVPFVWHLSSAVKLYISNIVVIVGKI